MAEKYIVTKNFVDRFDENKTYNVGDEYPRLGFEVSSERLESLASKNNRAFTQVITVDEEENIEPLEDKTIKELKAIADEANIEYDGSIKKKELIELLEK